MSDDLNAPIDDTHLISRIERDAIRKDLEPLYRLVRGWEPHEMPADWDPYDER